jgi:hypothetical protein
MRLLISATLLCLSTAAFADAQISIRVFTDTSVTDSVLTAAEDEAKFVLKTGGIEVTWKDCPKAPGCAAPVLSNQLIILIRPSKPDTFEGSVRGEILGNAAAPRDGSGIYAWIWYDAVKSEARMAEITWPDLLGYVIAHEIGHLLLGPAHRAGTVMQARWGQQELDLIARRNLRFDAGQRTRMRTCLVTRVGSTAINLASATAP